MLQNLVPVISQINPTVLMVLSGIAIVLFIFSILKKAVRVGIGLLIFALVMGGGIPTVKLVQESYGIAYNRVDDIVELKVAGQRYVIPVKEMLGDKHYDIDIEKDSKATQLSISYQRKDGTSVLIKGKDAIPVPNFMAGTVMKFFDKNDIKYTYTEKKESIRGSQPIEIQP